MITVYPSSVHADATALVIYRGTPNRSVNWTLTGSGTLTPIASYTGASGSAAAKYTPGTPGDIVTIGAESGA
jgi:hypothetical protein